MRAVLVREPGGPEVLEVGEVPDPVPGPGEVLVEVAASGVNRADLAQRAGSYPPPPGASDVLGLEVSGTVVAVGPNGPGSGGGGPDGGPHDGGGAPGAPGHGWQPGDRVCALLSGGGYAERVAVPAGQVMPVPAGVDLLDAAALPEAAATVWSTVFMAAGLRPGEVLLVHGGGSGIGTTAVQLARQAGAVVAVTAGSARKLAACAELGATVLVDHTSGDFVAEVLAATGGHGADVVLDVVGGPYLERNTAVMATGGRLVQLGLLGGSRAELDLGVLMDKRLSLLGSTLRSRSVQEKAVVCESVVEHVWPLVAEGRVRPVVSERVPVEQVARAHTALAAAEHIGKVVLTW